MHRRSFILSLALVLGAGAACSGAARHPCVIPAGPNDALASLQGTWRVEAWDPELAGTVHFIGDRVEARSGDLLLVGSWTHTGSDGNGHRVALRIDTALQDGVRQIYGTYDEVELTLAFVDADRLYALQAEGTWTQWHRVGIEAGEGQE